MGHNRLLLAVSLLLAIVGGSSLASGMGSAEPTRVNLSGGGRPAPTTLPDLFVDDDTSSTSAAPITSTTNPPAAAEVVTTTTVAPRTITTLAVVTTTTAPRPSTPTTTAPRSANSVRIDSIVNRYPHAIDLRIGSDDSIARWVLDPGETGAPAVIVVGAHDSSGSHVVSTPSCGRGDQDNYFTEGHRYTIEIVKNGIERACENDLPGYWAILHDVTAGTSKQF